MSRTINALSSVRIEAIEGLPLRNHSSNGLAKVSMLEADLVGEAGKLLLNISVSPHSHRFLSVLSDSLSRDITDCMRKSFQYAAGAFGWHDRVIAGEACNSIMGTCIGASDTFLKRLRSRIDQSVQTDGVGKDHSESISHLMQYAEHNADFLRHFSRSSHRFGITGIVDRDQAKAMLDQLARSAIRFVISDPKI